jgi:hypothetical protein
MCPFCLAATGLYVAGGLSTGAVSTIVITRILRKRIVPDGPESAGSTSRTESASDERAYTNDRVE